MNLNLSGLLSQNPVAPAGLSGVPTANVSLLPQAETLVKFGQQLQVFNQLFSVSANPQILTPLSSNPISALAAKPNTSPSIALEQLSETTKPNILTEFFNPQPATNANTSNEAGNLLKLVTTILSAQSKPSPQPLLPAVNSLAIPPELPKKLSPQPEPIPPEIKPEQLKDKGKLPQQITLAMPPELPGILNPVESTKGQMDRLSDALIQTSQDKFPVIKALKDIKK